jgi:DNA repair exonuclease SbcCD ATPase subunit
MNINKICHLADIHIRKTPTRNEEYQLVFNNLLKSLSKNKPDRIVIVGDLVHDYLDLQGEQLILASDFLNELAEIAPVRITRGNHDCRKKTLNRVDSVKAIVETLHNPKVIYYDTSDVYYDDNVAWMVWHHGDSKGNPWKTKEGKIYEKLRTTSQQYISIDLFHDPISGYLTTGGLEMKSKSYYQASDFKGDLSFFGDIHRMQYMNKAKTKAYCGSLIAQDVSEGDDNFHGYLLWDITTKTAEEIPIDNDWSYKNVRITPYTDFDDLDFEIGNPTKHMKVRFLWGTLPQTRTKDNERKLAIYLKSKYDNVTISHKNQFIESEKIDVNENITIQNIEDKAVQHEIFKEYLTKIGSSEEVINDVIALDEEILNEIEFDDIASIEWNVVKFGGKNFMSYETLDIDWRDNDGLYQITGMNTAGKTTIMKLLSYILFSKTLETETRVKYGDMRFVNNRNGADYCEGYLVLEAGGEYYGIKKRTEIEKNRSGEIKGAPTTLNYYLLSNPDEAMDEKTSLDVLVEDRKYKTQKKIESIIGSYDNFMRIVMTTSDTLNRILSNDMAVFIDSILFDSGCDIFDKKLEGLKAYQKRVNEKSRVSCNVEFTTTENATLKQEIRVLKGEITEIETTKLPDIQIRISKGRKYVEDLTKKLFKIDAEIYNLDIDATKGLIERHNGIIDDFKARKSVLETSILALRETYDEEKLNALIAKKDTHKTNEYSMKMKIKEHEQTKRNHEHSIEILNGDIFRLKKQGTEYKEEIIKLKNSKTCPTCGQLLTADHRKHIDDKIKEIEGQMFPIADQIKDIQNVKIKEQQDIIDSTVKEIDKIKKDIDDKSLEMEGVLTEIGVLTNDKNDVDRRKELMIEYDQIPTKIQNEELKISIHQQKIDNHDNSLKQIEENQRIEKGITAAKLKLKELEDEESDEKENVYIKKTGVAEKELKIKNNEILIAEFKIQEHRDMVISLYKQCVHRDGIPRQMLSNYILPNINITLENILSVSPFKVWLDPVDLRPKLVYNDRPQAIVDCISASGKERTFSSVVLKFALNQINVKAKPSIFLLDEVMGKLSEESIEEFIEILQMIKANMKKVLVIEHNHEINPDYLLNVQLNDDGISSVTME